MRGLVDFIAGGDRSEYVVSTLRDLEAFCRQERAALAELEQASREPLRLPSIDEACSEVADLDARLAQDPEAGREQLRRWIKDGSIRVGPDKDGAIVAEGELLPLITLASGVSGNLLPAGMHQRRHRHVAFCCRSQPVADAG